MLMCKRPEFQLYLSIRAGRVVTSEDDALKVVRLLTGIRSRKELIIDSDAAMQWQELITNFNKWNLKNDMHQN
ncbi:hypothetical protein [Aeromonas phage 59.1]|nr:hypothetical protein [Aeromonas phage 59.1]